MFTISRPHFTRALKSLAIGLAVLSIGLLAWVGVKFYSDRSSHSIDTAGAALVGGPFTAIDHTGKPVTDKDFLGSYMLVYFGYTFCPDVCPGELQILSAALDLLGPKANKIKPIFITVDPQRDTPEVLAEYVSNFYETLIGLTGTAEQMKAAAKAYYVYSARDDTTAPGGDYLVDHSALVFLMDPKGRYVRHFTYGTPPEDIAAALDEIIR